VAHASFNGLRVLSLESRRANEIEKLIRTYGGEPIVVPAMREVGLESNQQALEFAAKLLEGSYDLVIFMTGMGVRALVEIAQTRFDRAEFLAALRNVKIAARGAKPSTALRELKVPVHVMSDEPSTWHELVQAIDAAYGDSLGEMRVAIQEYGASNPELLAELSSRSRELTRVPVYQWALPEDLQPLRECVLGVLNSIVDVVLFMTAVQVIHLFQVAEQMGMRDKLREALRKTVVLSIGPTTSEELAHYGVEPDFEPSRPKMGFLVNEAAQYASRLLWRRSATARSKPLSLTLRQKRRTMRRRPVCGEWLRRHRRWPGFAMGWLKWTFCTRSAVVWRRLIHCIWSWIGLLVSSQASFRATRASSMCSKARA